MNQRARYLAAKRERLVVQAAAQRVVLAQQMLPWRARLAAADQGVAVLRKAGRHRLLLAGIAVLLVLWRPHGAVKWLQYGVMGWQVARKLRSAWTDSKTAP
ncbi:MAG: YqjK family protein [Burkholderiales bacterium]